MDCDGVLTADDCDDGNVELTGIDDADCDGVATADDCDDDDASTVNDMDCDGVLTADDCDDGDASSTVVADDGDCDGVLTVDDCDDSDASSRVVVTDWDSPWPPVMYDNGNTSDSADDFSNACGGHGGKDVAIRWVAPDTDTYVIDTSNFYTQFDTVLSVYDSQCQTLIACNDDASEYDDGSEIWLSAIAGETLIIVVDGYNSAEFGSYRVESSGF